jgi:hypothetical protein
MKAPDRSWANAQRLVFLNEFDTTYSLAKQVGPEYLRKIAALVLDFVRQYFERSVQLERTKFHPEAFFFFDTAT